MAITRAKEQKSPETKQACLSLLESNEMLKHRRGQWSSPNDFKWLLSRAQFHRSLKG